jgi:ubiquinone/menaquinone biosynthesis C-methylase UbiE
VKISEYQKQYELEEKYWWWVARRELITNELDRLVQKPVKMLDLGCGTGVNLRSFTSYGSTVGVDFSPAALAFCRTRVDTRLVQADAQDLPFENASFDVVCCLDVLEHIEDDSKAAREFFRVLVPRGLLVLTVPALQRLWSGHDEALGHKRRYDKRSLSLILNSNGFEVKTISYWNFSLLMPVAMVRLLKRLRKNNHAAASDPIGLPAPVNAILTFLLRFENSMILHGLNVPIGISLVCICTKKE